VQSRCEQAIAQAARSGCKVALLFVDLDNFKAINDSLGHSAGDAMLKAVASRLRECARETDSMSRHGGDEFLVVFAELPDAEAAIALVERLIQQFQRPLQVDGREITTSLSLGIALYPDDGQDFAELLKKADIAMYQAKEAGRNTHRFFNEYMNVEAVEHVQMRNGLRLALDRGEFALYYQPQIDLASGNVVGAEALIRWNHPELGLVLPGRFISVAEESGLIVPMGDWVLREACRQAVAWQDAGLPPLTVAVNLSAVQFGRGDVERSVERAVESAGLDPAYLELELTESILIQDAEVTLDSVRRLKALGVKLSVDDFGTGYSSLTYLKRFAVDKLKIDQSFVRNLASDPDDAAIVRAIIQMARSLKLKTIAEGVESEALIGLLQAFQCDEIQGYWFARPMPADALAAFVRSHQNKRQFEPAIYGHHG
jgi:diguanylate cyclase (GGDEF)-like protein